VGLEFGQEGARTFPYFVTLAPDGRSALSGHDDGTLSLWEVDTGQKLRTFAGDTGAIQVVAFAPDGLTALSAAHHKHWSRGPDPSFRVPALKLWDVSTGREIRELTGHTEPITSIKFAADGRTALSGSSLDGTLRLWDLDTGRARHTFFRLFPFAIAFAPDGRAAVSSAWHNTFQLLDLGTGQEIRTFTGHTGLVQSVAFASDGRVALSGSQDKTLKLWDVSTGRELRTLTGHSGWVLWVEFVANGRNALSRSSDGTFKLWDLHR
jgi:WD40 repeat protein